MLLSLNSVFNTTKEYRRLEGEGEVIIIDGVGWKGPMLK